MRQKSTPRRRADLELRQFPHGGQPVTCPACQCTGGVGVGVGSVSCDPCRNTGETTLAQARQHDEALVQFGDLFKP